MNKIIILGQMDNSDGTHEHLNRVYSADGLAATLFCGGGQLIVISENQGEQRPRIL